ncbi:MAG TPA: hypothetical protein VFT34_09555 [Verrucomicrobiae bacterium]|nr:hypothetical protein [Verrucomicrobiae bacterium]
MKSLIAQDFEIVFKKLDEALLEQGRLDGEAVPTALQECEVIQLLKETFEDIVEPPTPVYTRG